MSALPVGTAPMPNLEQKPAVDHDEDALKLEEQTTLRTFDPAFARRTERKVRHLETKLTPGRSPTYTSVDLGVPVL